jgi:hypothetical protein
MFFVCVFKEMEVRDSVLYGDTTEMRIYINYTL